MNELIFHSSWWLLGCVAIGGIAIFVAGNRRLDKNLQRIGIAIFALAVLLGLLRFFFPIARERMEIRSRAIVRAVDGSHWDTLRSLLDEQTAVCTRSHVLVGGRDAVVATVREDTEAFHVRSISITGIDSTQTETLITVSLEVYSVQDAASGRPATSSWQMSYEQSGDQWILDRITILSIDSEGIEEFNPRLPVAPE